MLRDVPFGKYLHEFFDAIVGDFVCYFHELCDIFVISVLIFSERLL